MMTLELDDDTGQLLAELMEHEHTDATQAVKKALAGYLDALKAQQGQPRELLTDIIATLPNLPSFEGDPVAIQKAMRDEWD